MNRPQGRPSTGGGTSAAAFSVRVGVKDDCKVMVENGKMIYWTELIRSVDEACDKFLALRVAKQKQLSNSFIG